jgi:hypothetical protein
MKHYFLTGLLLFAMLLQGQSQTKPVTMAESSGFTSTSNYSDVQSFISQLKSLAPKVLRVETMAMSVEGRVVPLLIFGDPLPKSTTKLKADPRIIIYIQANIHAGEVEGKEASLMLARDLATGLRKDVLKQAIVLICPNFNPDGNEAISTDNRIHQNGPKNGVGVRYNGQMLDLNRDAIKLESPELQGLLGKVLLAWDPDIMVDLHTTNGSYHDEPVTFTWMMNPAGDRSLINYMRDKMMPQVSATLKEKYKVMNCFYGEFVDQRDPSKGWISYASEPRYIVNYIGLRNRLSILNENYVYADFKTRVMGCYHLLHSILDYAISHSNEIQELLKTADANTVTRGLNPSAKDSFPVEYTVAPTPVPITIHTYDVSVMTDSLGRPRMIKGEKQKEVTVPYLADYFPTHSVALPYAYLLTVRDPQILNLLKAHGIKVEELATPVSLEVESFHISELKPAPRLNQGHYENTVKGTFSKETRNFLPGTCVIRTSQPLANLISYLLEPQTNDGLLLWNFFDRYLVPQWGRGYNPYPVYKVMQKTDLNSQMQ